jgi:uncharacterized membrane protein YeaQ/YmgE (transglycosylase-associated protein family)
MKICIIQEGESMSLIVALVLGGIIGWLGARLMGREEGIFSSIVIGVVGAIIGSVLARMLGSGNESYMMLSWAGVIWSLIGAVILSAILNAVQRHSHSY